MIAFLGLILGIGLIAVGAVLEGLHLQSLVQPTAAMIVFGGTLGAVMVGSNLDEFTKALKMLPSGIFGKRFNHTGLMAQLLNLANVARKEGIISLDKKLGEIQHPFLRQFLRQVIDGYDPEVMKSMMEETIYHEEEKGLASAKIYGDGGGYSPTIGIIGAVLGLIHVMGNLQDASKLGEGIAVAFVATIYGVGLANLVLLPLATKLKKIVKEETNELKLIYTGILGIQNGLNPRVIEDQLYNTLGVAKPENGGRASGEDAANAAAA